MIINISYKAEFIPSKARDLNPNKGEGYIKRGLLWSDSEYKLFSRIYPERSEGS